MVETRGLPFPREPKACHRSNPRPDDFAHDWRVFRAILGIVSRYYPQTKSSLLVGCDLLQVPMQSLFRLESSHSGANHQARTKKGKVLPAVSHRSMLKRPRNACRFAKNEDARPNPLGVPCSLRAHTWPPSCSWRIVCHPISHLPRNTTGRLGRRLCWW